MRLITMLFGVVASAATMLFLGCLLRTAFGALTGWVVGYVFSGTMTMLMVWIGQPTMELWQLGAILGFLTSFIPTSSK